MTEIKVTLPWLAFECKEVYELFKTYAEEKNIDIEDECEHTSQVQVSGNYTAKELGELNKKFHDWVYSSHNNVLVKEYQKIYNIVVVNKTLDKIAKILEQEFQASIDTLESGYIQVCTEFFQYTVAEHNGVAGLLYEVECFLFNEEIGSRFVKMNEQGEIEIGELVR